MASKSKRLKKELGQYRKQGKVPVLNKIPENSFALDVISEDNLHEWEGFIYGPKYSAYDGGVWKIGISVPSEYPFKNPLVKIKTPIFHPSVTKEGEICLPLLDNWKPITKLENIVKDILLLLVEIPEDAAGNMEAAELLKKDKDQFKMRASEDIVNLGAQPSMIWEGWNDDDVEDLRPNDYLKKLYPWIDENALFNAQSDQAKLASGLILGDDVNI